MPKPSEKVLSTIEYTVVKRSIQNFQQQDKAFHYLLSLSKTSLTSSTHHFQLAELFDISYRPYTNGQGFLYLHTIKGVFSFLISTNPANFIATYQKLVTN